MPKNNRVLVTGAGGFIGHHLVNRLKAEGYWVRGADIRYPEFEATVADEFQLLDLRNENNSQLATRNIDLVYHLAADTGGIGYISSYLADIARNNVLIDVNMLDACWLSGVRRVLFSSSACVYSRDKQKHADVEGLREADTFPADPEPGYGWEKLFAEQMCAYHRRDHHLDSRIVRFHNVYGPLDVYEGGREKAPAAICRKVLLAGDNGEIEIWGDGKQTRSFLYIDDCVEGLIRVMRSDSSEPLNVGTERLISIDELVDLVCAVSGKTVLKRHAPGKPQGVRGRNSDNSHMKKILGWQPAVNLEDGIWATYQWISGQLGHPSTAATLVA